jgi:hypothetical protein
MAKHIQFVGVMNSGCAIAVTILFGCAATWSAAPSELIYFYKSVRCKVGLIIV